MSNEHITGRGMMRECSATLVRSAAFFFFSSRRRHTRCLSDWSSDVCSSDLRPEDEVVVFADSDIRPAPDWLRQLVQPLADSTVGVATGFRWYLPPRPTFWSLVRAEWNAVSANVLFDSRRAFAWGGSCAVRRDDLVKLSLPDRWRNVLSDDLVLTRAVRDAARKIASTPAALVPTFEGADRRACLEWCFRQMTMATLYLPIVRRYAVAAFSIFIGSL